MAKFLAGGSWSKAAVLALAAFAAPAMAASGHDTMLPFDGDPYNLGSLQRGARNFMNYCSGCHGLKMLRYERMSRDLGIPEDILEANLMFGPDKPIDPIRTAMPAGSKDWFGRTPPDLSLTARFRGPEWVYSFLNSFYLDGKSPTGVNNRVLPGASMPHVLWELQGWQQLAAQGDGHAAAEAPAHGPAKPFAQVQPGAMSELEYKAFTADLTNFLTYAAEPGRAKRVGLGGWVMLYLLVLLVPAYLLKHEYWKNVH